MASDPDIIELNGKRYDARTGHLLSIPKAKPEKEKVPAGKKIKVTHHEPPHPPKKPHHVHHRTERAKTLMRQAVKKPIPVKYETSPSPSIQRSPSTRQPDPARLERARQTAKSHMVNKFGSAKANSSIKFITTELPVQPEPIPIAPPTTDESVGEHKTHRDNDTLVWQHALDRADGHTHPRLKKPNHRHRLSLKLGVSARIVNFGAAALAGILLVGFVVYQNIPNLSMRLAAQRAGVSGVLPNYQPSGFGLSGPIQYRPGRITLNFASHSDSRQFQIHQRASEWDDVSLVKNYLVPEYESFDTRQAGSKTVYIYDEHNATWLENGVWYQVEGDSSLTSNQLLRLATSM